MEEDKPNTGKTALNFGLILGGISIVFAMMLYSLDMHYQGGMLVLGVSVILMIAVIVLGMLQFKKANNGFMTLGQGLKVGLGIAIVGGVMGILFNQVMAGIIDPEMMEKAMEYQKGVLMETQLEMGKKFSTPSMQIVFGLVYSLVAGFIFSLIAALILKKQETNQ
jgi:DNA-binding transcriptional regulator of glucitol operon